MIVKDRQFEEGKRFAARQVPQADAVMHPHRQQSPAWVDGGPMINSLTLGWVKDQGAVFATASYFPQSHRGPVEIGGQEAIIGTEAWKVPHRGLGAEKL